MTTRFVLVRHAQSVPPVWDVPDTPDRPLTAEGLADARALAPELLALRPHVVVSSPYLRAVQTVRPLGLPVLTRHELREWDSGLTPSADFAVRAVAALRQFAREYPGRTVVVGSHGTFVSRALAGHGTPVDWDFVRAMPMPAVHHVSVVAVDDELVERVDPASVADRVDGGPHGA